MIGIQRHSAFLAILLIFLIGILSGCLDFILEKEEEVKTEETFEQVFSRSFRDSRYNYNFVSRKKITSEIDSISNGLGQKNDSSLRARLVTLQSIRGDSLFEIYSIGLPLLGGKSGTALEREVILLEVIHKFMEEGRYLEIGRFLQSLQGSINRFVIAEFHNIKGLIYLQQKKYRLSSDEFTLSLNAHPKYAPAILNQAFLLIKFGFAARAIKLLKKVPKNWLVAFGLLQAYRIKGKPDQTQKYCKQLLKDKKKHKAGLLSCGLNEFQGMGDFTVARRMFKKLVRIDEGEYSRKAAMLIDQVNAFEKGVRERSKKNDKLDWK